MDNKVEITREVVVASLKHCASGSRCTECPCGGAPACKDVYSIATNIIESDEITKAKYLSNILYLESEIEKAKKNTSEAIHQMWESMMKVQQVYSNRCKALESENERLKGR